MSDPVVMQVHVSEIDPPLWNSRLNTDPKKVVALAESIREQGQLEPIRVEALPNGRYRPIFGNRRLAAIRLLEEETIRAEVVEHVPNDADAMLNNIVENVSREDLTTFELARACAALRDVKDEEGKPVYKIDAVGRKLGLSKQYVSNLVTAYTSLEPKILKHWQQQEETLNPETGESSKVRHLRFAVLRELAGIDDPADQLAAYEGHIAALVALDNEEDSDGKTKKKKGKSNGGSSGITVVKANLNALIDVVKSKDAPKLFGGKEVSDMLSKTVDWLIGQRKTPPFDLEPLVVDVVKNGKLKTVPVKQK